MMLVLKSPFWIDSSPIWYNTGMPANIAPIPEEHLKKLYKEHTYPEIAQITGWSQTTVSRRLKALGITGNYRKTLKTRQKYADIKRGNWSKENNPNWKGGISNGRWREGSLVYWRNSVKRRDNYICQKCGLDGKIACRHCREKPEMHADHIKSWADYPKLRFEISNGITLCKRCHRMKIG